MSGPVSRVLLASRLRLEQFGEVEALLRQLGEEVRSTRKGHEWEVVLDGGVFSVSHRDTSKYAYDFEDDLLERQMGFEDAPEAFVIAAPTRRDIDRENLRRIAGELASLFGGIAFEGRG